ncbi:MAG: MFS transporter [Methanomicrobiales archaeon]|nr:MFS transporter [Methanomicrobiales archaeon]
MTTIAGSGAAGAGPLHGTMDPAQKRRVAFLLCFAAFATMLGIGIITPALPLYAQLMGATGFWIGVIFSSFALSRTLFLPVFGKLSDVHGRRLLLLLGLSGYAIFSALYVMADTVWSLACIRFLHGIAASMVFPVAVAYMGDIAEPGEEGQLLGGFHSAAFLGMSFGPLISGIMMDYVSIQASFLALALISVVTAMVCLRCLPDYRPKVREPVPILSVVLHPALRVPICFYLVYSVAYATYLVYLPIITGSTGHLSGTMVGLLIFIGTIVMAGVQRLSGRIVDTSNKYVLLGTGIGIIAVAAVLIALAASFAAYLGAVIVLGCGFGLSLTTVAALVTIAGRETGQGSAAGVVNMAQGLGLMIVPVIFGMVMDQYGVAAVFLVTAVITGAAAPVLLSIGRAPAVPPAGTIPQAGRH